MGYHYSETHICQCLSRISILRRDLPVTICGNRRKTGKQFVESVLSLAQGLLELGLGKGDIVAIAAFNSDWYLEWLLAVAFVGGIAAPLNYRWSFDEAKVAMDVVRPVILVIDESCNSWYSNLQNSNIPSLKWHVVLGDPSTLPTNNNNIITMEKLQKSSPIFSLFDYHWAPQGILLICFTSGTTGRPKGVAISHIALIVQSLAKIAIAGYGEDDVYLHTAPLCHIGGISSCMAMLMIGACHVLIPKFEANLALQAIEKYHVTSLITVPTMMVDLISFTRKKETWNCGKYLKKILNGGGGLSIDIIRDAIQTFPNAKLLSAYGMTEACSSLTFMTLNDPKSENSGEFNGKIGEITSGCIFRPRGVCVGKPAPHVELRICGEGSSLIGRILTRGPHVMLKYWGETPAMASDSGWFDTGDIGWIDENGDVWLIGRTKDRIKSGGENVYPLEVEAVLSQHPGILSIVVVGVPDQRLSEMLVGCVQIRENWRWVTHNSYLSMKPEELHLSTQILQNYCKQRNLTGFKIPKIFIMWTKPFPLTSTGKLRRDEIRREAMSQLRFWSSNL